MDSSNIKRIEVENEERSSNEVEVKLLRAALEKLIQAERPKANSNGPSEFPSLSGQPQQSHQNSAQSTWANPTQRSNHTPVQRPQQNSNIGQGGGGSQAQLGQGSQQQGHNDDLFPSSSQFANGLDDYRFGGQNAVGQLTGSSQPQTTNIEEFPPLGRTGNGEIGQDRREGMMQQNGFGGPSNGNEYGQHMTLQGRNNILRAMSGSTLVGSNGNRQANVGGGAGVVSPVGFGTSGVFQP